MGVDRATVLKMREKFPREKSSVLSLRAQIRERELADLVGDLGVLSRRAVDLKLQRMAQRMLQGNLDEYPGLVVAMGDLDNLKLINDAGGKDQGHYMGDAAIYNAFQMAGKIRPYDDLTRLGGDELGILMRASSSEEAKLLMEGGVGRDGVIPRIQQAVVQGITELKARFKERWVADPTDNKIPGQVTMGWAYLSREDFMKLYLEWQGDKKKDENMVGDFCTYVFKLADMKMFEKKMITPD